MQLLELWIVNNTGERSALVQDLKAIYKQSTCPRQAQSLPNKIDALIFSRPQPDLGKVFFPFFPLPNTQKLEPKTRSHSPINRRLFTMDRLPPEIREMILSDIPRSKWPLLATVSRAWQDTVEIHTFKRIEVRSTSSLSMDVLSSAAALTSCRAACIRSIIYTVELPAHIKPPSKEATDSTGDYVNAEDMKEDNRAFTHAIRCLFNILATWPTNTAAIDLRIQVTYLEHGTSETARIPEYAYIALEKHPQLPLLHCVGGLDMTPRKNSRRRLPSFVPLHIALETQARLSKLCLNLVHTRWIFYQPGIWLPLLEQMRTEAIEAMIPAGRHSKLPLFRDGAVLRLRTAGYMQPHHQRLPNLNFPLTYDPFCAALRNISLNLRLFHYSGTVDPALFWRAGEEDAETTPLPRWDFLERMKIHTSLGTSSGQRLYRGDGSHPSNEPLPPDAPSYWPPGYGHPSEDGDALAYARRMLSEQSNIYKEDDLEYSLRPVPNTPVLEPLLIAFARAIGAMPKLKLAKLLIWHGSAFRIYINYSVKYKGYLGEPLPGCAKNPGSQWPRLFVQLRDGLRLDPGIVDIFRESAKRVQGRELLVLYLPEGESTSENGD